MRSGPTRSGGPAPSSPVPGRAHRSSPPSTAGPVGGGQRPGGRAPQRRVTGPTRLTWTDVRHVRRPAPAPRGRTGPRGRAAGGARRVPGSGVEQPARARAVAAGRGRVRRGRRTAPVDDVPIPLRRLAASRPRSGPGSAAPRCSPNWRPPVRSGPPSSPGGTSTGRANWRPPWTTRWRPPRRPVLRADPAAADAVALAARRGEAVELRAERDEALARVDKLTGELERLRAELADAGPPSGPRCRSAMPSTSSCAGG